MQELEGKLVANLLLEDGEWNKQLFHELSNENLVQLICSIEVHHNELEDALELCKRIYY